MARRPNWLQQQDPMPAGMERHIRALGFDRSREYFDWCWANGFAASLEKSRQDLQEEIDLFKNQEEKRAAQTRMHRNPKGFLEAVCRGDLLSDEIERPIFKQVAAEIETSNEAEDARESLFEFLVEMLGFGDLVFQTSAKLDEPPFVRGLIKLHDRKALWLRTLNSWKPKSKNRDRMFGELTHHFFDKFGDVPRFMEAVWLRNDRPSWRYRDWYVHLGRGHNLRKAKTVVPLTRNMAHHFTRAPENYSAEQAIRWGQMKALGATEISINAVVATRLGRSFVNEEFWFTVIRFIVDNPMLDPRQIGPMIDFIHNQRFEPVEIEIEPGVFRTDPPPQPGLSMRGRTVETLMRQVAAWHASLGRVRDMPNGDYAPAKFRGIAVEHGQGRAKKRWIIRQLRSPGELQRESDALRHCVASYHWSCARGQCTIWSLAVTSADGATERRQTIEVDSTDTIVQCRGLANRDPSREEWSIVNKWASEERLYIASYLS